MIDKHFTFSLAKNALKSGFVILLLVVTSCQVRTPQQNYIDQDYPTDKPKLFAHKTLDSFTSFVQNMDVSVDLQEYYFAMTDSIWNPNVIMSLKMNGANKYVLDTIVDARKTGLFRRCYEPSLSSDGNKLFFSTTSGDIFEVVKEDGKWSAPRNLGAPVNSDWRDGHPTLADNGTMYFHSFEKTPYENAIFYSPLEDGQYLKRIRIDALCNIGDAGDPCIAPDESFIVFVSSRKGGYGKSDLYISLKTEQGWTVPKNLGEEINSEEWEFASNITPDGKYLFFTRQNDWSHLEFMDIYWVDIQSIKERLASMAES